MSLEQALLLLQQYGYLLLFPLAVIEGPIISVVAGLLVTAGVFNLFTVYAIVVAGDIVGDTAWYVVGRFGGGPLSKFLERLFGVTPEKIQAAKQRFENNRFKMTAFSKLIHGVGVAGLVAAGIVRTSYPLFVLACLMVTVGQAAVFLTLGILFGHAYKQIEASLSYVVAGGVVIALCALVFIWWRWRSKKQS